MEESCCDLKLKQSQKEVPYKFRSGKLWLFHLLVQLSCSRSSYYANNVYHFTAGKNWYVISSFLCVKTASNLYQHDKWELSLRHCCGHNSKLCPTAIIIKIIVCNDDLNSINDLDYLTPQNIALDLVNIEKMLSMKWKWKDNISYCVVMWGRTIESGCFWPS